MGVTTFPSRWDGTIAREQDTEQDDSTPAVETTDDGLLDRFAALFVSEIPELRDLADEYGATLVDVARVYEAIRDSEQSMISHADLQERLGLSGPETWATASVLVDFGEFHRAKDGQWWWVYASGYLAELCRERELSLKRYIEMRPILREFQDEVVRWYQIRHMHGNLQPKTMGEIKLDYCRRLQREYWGLDEGEKPVEVDTWSDHRVSRYVRTAQDEIVEAHHLTY